MSKKSLGQWARLSTGIHRDPSYLRCSKDARYLFLSGIAVAKELNDDGHIDLQVLAMYQFGVMDLPEVELAAIELVDKGLWSHEGGMNYRLRSFLKWNESTAEQEEARDRKRLGALKTNHRRGLHTEAVHDCPMCAADENVSPGQNTEGAIAPASADGVAGASGALPLRRQETETETETGDVCSPRNADNDQTTEPNESNPGGSTTPKKKPTKRPEDYPDEVHQLCTHLADRIEQYRGGNRPAIGAQWYKQMDLLLRIGPLHLEGKNPLSATKVFNSINALFDDLAIPNSKGFCWASQIQSAPALRDHWVQLSQAHSDQSRGAAAQPSGAMPLEDQKQLSTALAELAAGADV